MHQDTVPDSILKFVILFVLAINRMCWFCLFPYILLDFTSKAFQVLHQICFSLLSLKYSNCMLSRGTVTRDLADKLLLSVVYKMSLSL